MADLARPLRFAILGAGSRGASTYGETMRLRPDLVSVVAVADPDRARAGALASRLGLEPAAVYADALKLIDEVADLDGVVVATPDHHHVAPTVAALRRGSAVLLEKPIAPTPEGVEAVAAAAAASSGTVSVSHVLRYTPFFRTAKRLIDEGRIGRLLVIDHEEHIGYWHFAHSFVRGNWRREADSSPMLLAKACHDLDILRWFAGGPCLSVVSTGELDHFRAENAPAGATLRCTDGCAVERTCPYSALRIYTERYAGQSGWPNNVVSQDTSTGAVVEALRSGPYGRCVYHCDNDVADNQLVQLTFEGGVRASLSVSAFTATITRRLNLMGTHGQITGDLKEGVLELEDFSSGARERIHVGSDASGHGGGDAGLIIDFLTRTLRSRRGVAGDASPTALTEALDSHRMAFAAERSRREGGVVRLA